MPRCPPILKRPSPFSRNDESDDHMPPRKPWTAYLGPAFLVVLLLIPQPSWFVLLSSQYVPSSLRLLHGAITTTLTLLAINSLAICTLRDPGRPSIDDMGSNETNHRSGNTLTVDHYDEEDEALLEEEEEEANDFNSTRKWCRTCWAPKPDRTHHCSACGRCVLRMDHHCPWVSQCVGHRTHAAFLHLLLCVTLLSLYIGVVAALTMYSFLFMAVAQPIQDSTPLHCLMLVILGFIFAMVIGSFFGFHVYICFTNQTTLEQLSPFILLKYLPKPKTPRHAPGTSITHGSGSPVITRDVPISSMPEAVNESPYHFPSPPQTPPPPPPPLDTLRHVLLASNPLSTIPASSPASPSASRDLSPSRVFSGSPVATTANANSSTVYHEWDEHSLSFAQRRLVRRAADRLGLWDLGWRRNVIATLGSGDPSMRKPGRFQDEGDHAHMRGEEGTSLTGPSATSRHRDGGGAGGSGSKSRRGGIGQNHARPYSWQWWLSVLLNGGPPRGDGRTFARNPKARFALEELRRGLEEAEIRERGGASEQHRIREDLAVGPRRGRRGPPSSSAAAGPRRDEMELHEV